MSMSNLVVLCFSVEIHRVLRPVSVGFHQDVMHIYYSVMLAKLYFLHKTKRREKEVVSPWWNSADAVSHTVKRDEIPTES